MALRPAVFDRQILSLDVTGFAQSLAERDINSAEDGPGDPLLRTPITGIAFCCARAASGHAAITPARKIMKSRRLMTSASRSDGEQGLWLKRATSDRLREGQLSARRKTAWGYITRRALTPRPIDHSL
jgi:hypothetical protein